MNGPANRRRPTQALENTMTKSTKSTAKAAAKKTTANSAPAKKAEPVVTTERVARLTPTAAANVNATVKSGLKTGQKPVEADEPRGKKTATKSASPKKADSGSTRGGDQKYRVLSKENPFREGTGRHGAWKILSKHTSTAAVRAESALYGTAVFFRELEKRGLIKFV
jgi:hypothetical protein